GIKSEDHHEGTKRRRNTKKMDWKKFLIIGMGMAVGARASGESAPATRPATAPTSVASAAAAAPATQPATRPMAVGVKLVIGAGVGEVARGVRLLGRDAHQQLRVTAD